MRSLVRVGLRPSRTARISFGVQLTLVIFWLIYGLFMLFSYDETEDRNYFYVVFIVLALLYMAYILAQNTPLFGRQSYFEITRDYLVVKRGHFRSKLALPFENMQTLHLASNSIKVTMKDGSTQFIDLRQINRKKNIEKVKNGLREQAKYHHVAVTEVPTNI